MKRVLITGASGYIGKHIVLALLQDGYEVKASVRDLAKGEEVKSAVSAHLDPKIDVNSRLSFVELDLEKDTGWDSALEGIDVLMHTASPFPIASPKNEDDVIVPAVQGTLRALRAAHNSGVKRVILTSSVAAIYGTNLPTGKTAFDETIFTDVNHPVGKQTYTKSKTLAEAAAWDFVKFNAPEIKLTTINPVLVLGAPLDRKFGSSVSIIERLLAGKDPMLPDLTFSIVNVKDVARMHVEAISNDATISQRIIASSSSASFVQMAKILQKAFPNRKFKTIQAPNFVIRILGLFDGDIKSILPMLGDKTPVDSAKAKNIFGMQFINTEETIIETAKFLLNQTK